MAHRVMTRRKWWNTPAVGTLQLTDRLITIIRASPSTQVAPATRLLPQ